MTTGTWAEHDEAPCERKLARLLAAIDSVPRCSCSAAICVELRAAIKEAQS
jgi:hypothetical protein